MFQASSYSAGKRTCQWMLPETHKGLKRVTLICLLCPMLVIISKVPYLEREEEITDQSNFVNNVT